MPPPSCQEPQGGGEGHLSLEVSATWAVDRFLRHAGNFAAMQADIGQIAVGQRRELVQGAAIGTVAFEALLDLPQRAVCQRPEAASCRVREICECHLSVSLRQRS